MELINDDGALPRKKKQTLFVIFAGSKKQDEAGIRYIANDGSTTTMRSLAARFWTFWGAKAFAEVNHIVLNTHTYIDREVFTEFEQQGQLIEEAAKDLLRRADKGFRQLS